MRALKSAAKEPPHVPAPAATCGAKRRIGGATQSRPPEKGLFDGA
jgi:hypothetical protein